MKKVVPRSVALYRYCRGYFLFHRIISLRCRIFSAFYGKTFCEIKHVLPDRTAAVWRALQKGPPISEEESKGNSRRYLRRKEKENGKKDGYNL